MNTHQHVDMSGSNACVNDMIHANQAECEDRRKLLDSQKSLHLVLKPEMVKLCQVLLLSEDLKTLVEMFLEYVMNNHHVNRESATILQAFQISLCWTAASLLKHKIGHKKSLALAKQHLDFGCKKEEADYVYSMLRCLKKMFLYRTGNFKMACTQKASECFDEHVLSELVSFPEFQLAKKDFSKSIKHIKKKCNKQMSKLLQKHQEEKEDLERKYEEEKAQLENKKRVEAAVIRLHSNVSMRGDKLKILDNVYAKKFEELKCQRDIHLKNLDSMQVAAMSKVQEREARWVEGVKYWAQVELANPPLDEPGHGVEYSETSERVRAHDCRENVIPVSGHFSEGQSDKVVHSMQGIGVRSSEIHETDSSVVACSDPINTVTLPVRPNSENHGLDAIASEGAPISGFRECNRAGSSGEDQDNRVSMNVCSKQQILVRAMPDGENRSEVPETVSSSDGSEGVLPVTSEEQIPDGATLSMPYGDIPSVGPETVNSTDGMENVVSLNAPRSEEQVPDGATVIVHDGEVQSGVPETLGSCGGLEHVVSVNSPSSEEQVPDGATVIVHDGEVQSGVPETLGSCGGPEHVVSVNSPSSEEQIPGGTTVRMSDGEVPSGVLDSSNGVENIISMNPPPSGEQIPNGVTLLMPETVAGEVVEGGGTSRENGEECATASDNSVGVSQQDRVDCVVDQEINFQEHSNSVQPVTIVSQGGPAPSNQDPSDVCSLPCTSTGVQEGDAAASETQSLQVEPPLSHPVDVVASDQSNHEAPVMEPAVQVQLLPPTDSSNRNNLPDLPSASRIESQPSVEGHISNQIAQAPMQLEENNIELSNQAFLQLVARFAQHPPIDTPIGGLASHASDMRTVSMTSGLSNRAVQTPHVSQDPLQNELERIRKEMDQTIKIHEETKLQLKSDFDKEIEEVFAKIRRKYETKLQEIEAEFLPKKEELDTIQNTVLMNKILAEAFRSKCMSGAPGTQHEMSSTFVQQLFQFSSQQTAQRPSLVAGTPSGCSPATGLQTTVVPAVSLQTVPPSTVSPRTTAPPLQSLFSGILTRPPYISSVSPPTGNLQVSSEIRAPAPHLQPFRPSTSMSATSLPSLSPGIPSQQALGNPTASSPSLSELLPRLPPPMYQSGNSASWPESAGGLPALPNSSVSAMELLMDVDNRSGANPNLPSSMPHLPELGSNVDTLVQLRPQCGLPSSMQANPACTSGATDTVCLSDDD